MKDTTILLVNPWIYDFAAHDYWSKPLGLLYLAAVLEKQGYSVRLIDCLWADATPADLLFDSHPKRRQGRGKFIKTIIEKPGILRDIPRKYGRYGISLDAFAARLAAEDSPRAILVSSGMTYWYPGPHKVIELVKIIFPRAPVILGGIYATLLPEFARRHSGADYVLPGGELDGLCRLLAEIADRTFDGHGIPRVLDDFPFPAYHLLSPVDAVGMLTSRGCPFRCSFCASHRFFEGFEQRNPSRVFEEIVYYHDTLYIKDVAFYDDALLMRKETHLLPLLRRIASAGPAVRFHTPNGLNPDALDAQTAEAMRAAQFVTIRLSFESADRKRQMDMNWKVTSKGLASALNNLEAAGYRRKDIGVYLLMGLPGQKPEEVEESIQVVHDLGATIHLSALSPIPGTGAWDEAVREYGFDPDSDPLLHNNTVFPLRNADFPYERFKALRDLASRRNHGLS